MVDCYSGGAQARQPQDQDTRRVERAILVNDAGYDAGRMVEMRSQPGRSLIRHNLQRFCMMKVGTSCWQLGKTQDSRLQSQESRVKRDRSIRRNVDRAAVDTIRAITRKQDDWIRSDARCLPFAGLSLLGYAYGLSLALCWRINKA